MTTTLLHPQGDYDLAKAESSRLPGLAAGTGRRGRGHLDSAPSFLDECPGQSLTRCWPKQLEYLCMRRQEARGATHWSWIQDRQMILDDAAPMRLTRVMYSVTAMHWGSSGMESKQLDIKSWLVHLLVVDVVCSAASARLKAATTEAKKARGRHLWNASRMQWVPNINRRRKRNFWVGMHCQSGQLSRKNWLQGCCLCYVETWCE